MRIGSARQVSQASEKGERPETTPDAFVGRRRFLATSGLASLGLASCRSDKSEADLPGAGDSIRTFHPVKVSRERVIRTVVGLRPFRPSGFALYSEPIGNKLLVHNYGHGGGGVTLSWGTAHLAVEKAETSGAEEYAVIGSGAVGLATARILQRRGHRVTIYARDLPPETTSNIAGAQWNPFTVSARDRRTPEFMAVFERAARISHRYFQDLPGDVFGIRWVENYGFSDEINERHLADPIHDLYPDSRWLAKGEHPFPPAYARRFSTMLIEMPIYLDALMRDFFLWGGDLVVREFTDPSQLLDLSERVVMNCTGMGSRELFGDEELTAIKGQLTVLLPQPEIDYITLAGNLYMFPRRDGILLGGTTERDVWSLDVNREAETRILAGHEEFFRQL